MIELDTEILTGAATYALSGFLGSIGAVASYLYEIDRGKREFKFSSIACVSIIGLVMGAASASFIPDHEHLVGVTLIAGLVSYPLLGAAKEKVGPFVDRTIERIWRA